MSSAIADIGLSLNTEKSFCIHVKADPSIKKAVISNEECFFNGRSIRTLSADDEFRYLGVRFSPSGLKPTPHGQIFDDALNQITAAPLKSHQRLEILRTFLIPRHLHTLVLDL